MLKLKKLELEGFRSFKEKSTIPFPESGIMLISGQYADASISSGSGKSSVIMAIAFALGYCDRPATALKNRSSKKMRVCLTLFDESHTYDVIRDPKLSLVIDGAPYETTSVGAEEKLKEILKTSPELAKALTYRPQRKPGTFINKTDADMKEFLATLLGLDKLELAADDFSTQLKQSELWVEQSNANLKQMLDFVSQNVVLEVDFEKAKQDYEIAQMRYNEVIANSENPELHQKLLNLKTQIDQIQSAKMQTNRARQDIENLKSEILKLANEIKTLSESLCYTCHRQWDNAQEEMERKKERAKTLMFKVKENEAVVRNAEPMLGRERQVSEEYQQVNQSIGQLKAPITDALNALNASRSNLTRITQAKASSDKTKTNCMELKNKITDAEQKARLLKHACNIVGRSGFMSEIFDEVLAEIEARSNDLMVYLPNVATYSISISSVGTTKAGMIKKTISTKLLKDAQEVDIKDLSGGQQCGVELSTDLAVAESIRARSGSPLGWIALDEAMDGLDVESKRAAIEAIKQKTKSLVIIVDHSTEVKESFDSVVTIVYDGRDSRVAA